VRFERRADVVATTGSTTVGRIVGTGGSEATAARGRDGGAGRITGEAGPPLFASLAPPTRATAIAPASTVISASLRRAGMRMSIGARRLPLERLAPGSHQGPAAGLPDDGRGWFRTSDLSRVKRALSH
jgi:hypothetical protein